MTCNEAVVVVPHTWAPLYLKKRTDHYKLLQGAQTIDLFAKTAPPVYDEPSDDEEPVADAATKKGTLKRLLERKKRQMQGRAEAPPPLRLDNVIHDRFEAELRKLEAQLRRNSNVFAVSACTAAGVLDRQQQADVAAFAPWLLMDVSITKHPQLTHIGLMDNRIFIEIGRAQLRSFVMTDAADHCYSLDEAERKFDKVCKSAEFWMLQKFGSRKAQHCTAVAWSLDDAAHEPLLDFDCETRLRRLLAEAPLLMIAALSQMVLLDEMDRVIAELMKFDY